MRFVSHAEMLKVFERACRRADIEVEHSRGFNPRPRLSLPLPRSVGVESDDELLCVRIDTPTGAQEHKGISDLCTSVRAKLSEHLPEGCELLSASLAQADTSFRPCSATYALPVRRECLNDELRARIERLLASESLIIERRVGGKSSKSGIRNLKFKSMDVRPFLRSIEVDNEGIIVDCKITSAGSIRIEEILKLLELDVQNLAAPIRRTNVQWQQV